MTLKKNDKASNSLPLSSLIEKLDAMIFSLDRSPPANSATSSDSSDISIFSSDSSASSSILSNHSAMSIISADSGASLASTSSVDTNGTLMSDSSVDSTNTLPPTHHRASEMDTDCPALFSIIPENSVHPIDSSLSNNVPSQTSSTGNPARSISLTKNSSQQLSMEDGFSECQRTLNSPSASPRNTKYAFQWLRRCASGSNKLLVKCVPFIHGASTENSSHVFFVTVKSHAMYLLAEWYRHGHPALPQNLAKAWRLLETSTKRSHPIAAYRGATCCERGLGRKCDRVLAVSLYRISAVHGYIPAMYRLARMLSEDSSTSTECFKWLNMASYQTLSMAGIGHVSTGDEIYSLAALHMLSSWYREGRPQAFMPNTFFVDVEYGLEMLYVAASYGYPPSQFLIGQVFEVGESEIPVNIDAAVYWYQKLVNNPRSENELFNQPAWRQAAYTRLCHLRQPPTPPHGHSFSTLHSPSTLIATTTVDLIKDYHVVSVKPPPLDSVSLSILKQKIPADSPDVSFHPILQRAQSLSVKHSKHLSSRAPPHTARLSPLAEASPPFQFLEANLPPSLLSPTVETLSLHALPSHSFQFIHDLTESPLKQSSSQLPHSVFEFPAVESPLTPLRDLVSLESSAELPPPLAPSQPHPSTIESREHTEEVDDFTTLSNLFHLLVQACSNTLMEAK